MAHVLIIDDDPKQAQALASLLARQGHQAECAAGVTEARRLLQDHSPDLLIVDVMMPGTTGLQAMDAFTDDPAFADLRFVIYSGSDDPAFVAEAQRLGAAAYVQKGQPWPSTYAQLAPHLEQALPPAPPAPPADVQQWRL
ncbi:MAG TPA: response regulator [Tepidisphaeraceae bacterium]|jgi:CheY-like chemotaxis protein